VYVTLRFTYGWAQSGSRLITLRSASKDSTNCFEQLNATPKPLQTAAHSGLSPEHIAVLKKAFRTSGWNGYVRKRIDLLEEKSKKEYVSPTTMAGVHALAGEIEPAFAWLEKAIDKRDPWLSLIKIQPAYDSLRPDPRFAKMLQRVNLSP
jgi:hypothetical protein